MDVDEVAAELYGLPPERFTPTRNERSKQARAEGDRELATQITALRKPTTAAWLTNLLVRSHPEEVQLLLDLGRELRDVLADVEGDELRELTRQRYQLVSALVSQARALAQARGRRVSDEVAAGVRTTLEATLADEASADVVAAGQLTDVLEVAGFGISPSGGRAAPAPTAPDVREKAAPVTDLESERRRRAQEQAQRQLAAAEKREARARQIADETAQRLREIHDNLVAAAAVVTRLRAELEQADNEVADLETRQESASSDEQTARQELEAASDEVVAARARAAALHDP
ncbi:MAG TPA: hypothetical protein VES21_01780 [Nocardioidaceae bacterium]|nr:hypothetical protein [Nocardioidaceae bacterium]